MEGNTPCLILLGFTVAFLKLDAANVKLSGGFKTSSHYYGILQVYQNNEWGTVCDNRWNKNNNKVVCRQLGYTNGTSYISLGIGSGPIWLDDVLCTGLERSIDKCKHRGWGNHNCDHDEDVGVICYSGLPNIAFRLHDTPTAHVFRLEARLFGTWQATCLNMNNTALQDANVVCRMAGYTRAVVAYKQMSDASAIRFPIAITMNCNGDENSTEECNHVVFQEKQLCITHQEYQIVCQANPVQKPDIAVRLVNGSTYNQGRVEVRYYGIWGTICDDLWELKDAHVVCRMLNYSKASWAGNAKVKGSGPIFLDEVQCRGNEKSLEYCDSNSWGQHDCGHGEDAGVTCKDVTRSVRLVNGSTSNQGRVEVRYNGVWGTVCNDRWDLADAYVVCRMLNYSKASWAGTAKVKGSGPIFLDEVQCRGNEKSLEYCDSNSLGQHDCGHGEDAGVTCTDTKESPVTARLGEADQRHLGRVEVNYNGTWIPVCDDTWDILDAHVICRMLGYKAVLATIRRYTKQNSSLWMGGVECTGEEVSIGECYHRGWANALQCPGDYGAGLICKVNKDPPPVRVRLEDGRTPNSGRVAVRYGNVWGTICNRGLDINDAKVICRMLGYPSALYTYNSKPGNGTIWLSNLECKGTENSIVDCRHPGWGQTTCNHNNDAALNCTTADPPQFQINGKSSITYSTMGLLFNDSQPIEVQRRSVYQVAVEIRKNEQRLASNEQLVPFIFNEVNVTMAAEMGNDSYITAEILGPISNLTIGNGQYYHGYYNAPLEPGSMYRVYVRIVTMAMDGERIYGDSSCVAFKTKPFVVVQGNKTIHRHTRRKQYFNDCSHILFQCFGIW